MKRTSAICIFLAGAANVALLIFPQMLLAEGEKDDAALRTIVRSEDTAWNAGDAEAYSVHFDQDGTFTNIQGLFFTGHQAFMAKHADIFKGLFHGTKLTQEVASLRFVRPDVAVLETVCTVSGFSAAGPPPGSQLNAKGQLVTRLLQVMVKNGGEWKIASYHNVDVKAGPPPGVMAK